MNYLSVAAAFAFMAMLVQGDYIHFNNTHQQCDDEDYTVVDYCMSLYYYNLWMTNADSIEPYCTMNWEVIACVETAQCYCNYSADSPVQADGYYDVAYVTYLHNYIMGCGNATYGESIGSDVIRPIEETPGVDCSQYNETVNDLPLVLTAAEDPDVIEMAETCEGVLACYRRFDEDVGEALYRQDLFTTCTSTSEMIECLVMAICACGQNNNEYLIDWVTFEREWMMYWCDIVFYYLDPPTFGIICPVSPAQPSHNCSGAGTFIPETSTESCVCTSQYLGSPAGNLVWLTEDGAVLETGSNGITELPLPPDVLTRAYDHTQLVCKAVGPVTSKSVTLPLSIAYGPDTVHLQVYEGRDHGDQPFALFYCNMSEMNPLSPDMVEWIGACEDQNGGFTCQVDPRVVNTTVGCRVVNWYNNNHTVQSERIETNFTTTTPSMPESDKQREVPWAVVGSLVGVAAAMALLALITLCCCLMRRRRRPQAPPALQTEKSRPMPQTFRNRPIPLYERSLWQPPFDARKYVYVVPPAFPRY